MSGFVTNNKKCPYKKWLFPAGRGCYSPTQKAESLRPYPCERSPASVQCSLSAFMPSCAKGSGIFLTHSKGVLTWYVLVSRALEDFSVKVSQ